jgi:hypothetical protein
MNARRDARGCSSLVIVGSVGNPTGPKDIRVGVLLGNLDGGITIGGTTCPGVQVLTAQSIGMGERAKSKRRGMPR